MICGTKDQSKNSAPLPLYYIAISPGYQAQHIQTSLIRGILEQAASAIFAVPLGELRAPRRRSARAAFARQVAMYLAHVVFGLNLTCVGIMFGRDRTTVAHGCAVVEDWREQPARDRALHLLESALLMSLRRSTACGGEAV